MVKKAQINKPPKDYPLRRHEAAGQWYKTIQTKCVYFGVLADPDSAKERYDNLLAGKGKFTNAEILANEGPATITVEDAVNSFLTAKTNAVQNGELGQRSLADYTRTCERIIRVVGHDSDLAKVKPDVLVILREDIAKSRGFVAMTTELQRCKTFFKWCYDSEKLAVPIRTKIALKPPSKRSIRAEKNTKPVRMFQAAELRSILLVSKPVMRAMILLAANCAFGQTDISTLPRQSVDLKTGWIDFPRPKTSVLRRCKLWPESVAALSDALDIMPKAKATEDQDCVFVTKYGARFVRFTENDSVVDSVALEFGKILTTLKLKRPGLNFYGIRHTFQTVADDVASANHIATKHIMGHSPPAEDMSSSYRELISDARITDVTNTVRQWLWPAGSEAEQVKVDALAPAQTSAEPPAESRPKATRKKRAQAK